MHAIGSVTAVLDLFFSQIILKRQLIIVAVNSVDDDSDGDDVYSII